MSEDKQVDSPSLPIRHDSPLTPRRTLNMSPSTLRKPTERILQQSVKNDGRISPSSRERQQWTAWKHLADSKDQEIANLKRENAGLQQKVMNMHDVAQKARIAAAAARKDKQLPGGRGNHEAKKKDRELRELRDQLERALRDLNTSQQDHGTLLNQIQSLSAHKAELETSLKELQTQSEKHMKEMKEMQQLRADAQERAIKGEAELATQRGQSDAKEKQYIEAIAKYEHDMEQGNVFVQKAMARAQMAEEATEAGDKRLRQELAISQQRTENARTELFHAQHELGVLNSELATSQEQLSALRTAMERERMQTSVTMERERNALSQQLAEVRGHLGAERDETTALQREKDELAEKLQKTEERLISLEQTLSMERDSFRTRHTQLQESHDELLNTLKTTQDNLDKLRSERDTFQIHEQELQSSLQSSRVELGKAKDASIEQGRKTERLEDSLRDILREFQSLARRFDELSSADIDDLLRLTPVRSVMAIRTGLDKLEEILQKSRRDEQRAQRELTSIREELETASVQVESQLKINQTLKKRLEDDESHREASRGQTRAIEEVQRKLTESQEETRFLEAALKRARGDIEQLESQLFQQPKAQKRARDEDNDELQQLCEELKSKLRRSESYRKEERETLRKALDALKQKRSGKHLSKTPSPKRYAYLQSPTRPTSRFTPPRIPRLPKSPKNPEPAQLPFQISRDSFPMC